MRIIERATEEARLFFCEYVPAVMKHFIPLAVGLGLMMGSYYGTRVVLQWAGF